MFYKLTKKPLGYFPKPSDNVTWYDLFNEDGTYAYGVVEVLAPAAVSIHINMIRWSASVRKSLTEDWKEFKVLCRSYNIKTIVAPILASGNGPKDNKWRKFIKLFGFPEPKLILSAQQEI